MCRIIYWLLYFHCCYSSLDCEHEWIDNRKQQKYLRERYKSLTGIQVHHFTIRVDSTTNFFLLVLLFILLQPDSQMKRLVLCVSRHHSEGHFFPSILIIKHKRIVKMYSSHLIFCIFLLHMKYDKKWHQIFHISLVWLYVQWWQMLHLSGGENQHI